MLGSIESVIASNGNLPNWSENWKSLLDNFCICHTGAVFVSIWKIQPYFDSKQMFHRILGKRSAESRSMIACLFLFKTISFLHLYFILYACSHLCYSNHNLLAYTSIINYYNL